MKNKSHSIKAVLGLALIFLLFALSLWGINSFAAPIIQSQGAALELKPFFELLPQAQGFELMYKAGEPEASSLQELPDTVQSLYRETGGLGYVLELSTQQGYTGKPIELSLAIDSQGKISAITVNSYPETKELGADYPDSYIGQDSSLAQVGLVAGVTYSSSAFKNAVSDAFSALIDKGLISPAQKAPEQVLLELLPRLFSGMANNQGVAQYEEQDLAGGYSYIKTALESLNGGGFAYLAKAGDENLLAICNGGGECRVYDVQGLDVTAQTDKALIQEAVSYTERELESFSQSDIKKLGKMLPESGELSPVPMAGIFSSVTGVYEINNGGSSYYAFAARPYGYSNLVMSCYYVLDSSGAIVAMSADEFIHIKEYFSDYELDEAQYKAGFQGLEREDWQDDYALISGATASSQAVSTATRDVFEAFDMITGGSDTGGGE